MSIFCRDLAMSLLELQEGQLSPVKRAALQLHLSFCKHCQRYVRQLTELTEALSRLDDGAHPPVSAASMTAALAAFRGATNDGRGPGDGEGVS